MKRTLPGFGLLLVVIAIAIVLWLAAKAWRGIAPSATKVVSPQTEGSSQTTDELNKGSRSLPDLHEMRRSTKRHTEQVDRIREETD